MPNNGHGNRTGASKSALACHVNQTSLISLKLSAYTIWGRVLAYTCEHSYVQNAQMSLLLSGFIVDTCIFFCPHSPALNPGTDMPEQSSADKDQATKKATI